MTDFPSDAHPARAAADRALDRAMRTPLQLAPPSCPANRGKSHWTRLSSRDISCLLAGYALGVSFMTLAVAVIISCRN